MMRSIWRAFIWLRLQYVYWRLDRMERRIISVGLNYDLWSEFVDEQVALENVLNPEEETA